MNASQAHADHVEELTSQSGSPLFPPWRLAGYSNFFCLSPHLWASQVAQWYRAHLPMPETRETWVQSLGQKDSLDVFLHKYMITQTTGL